MEITYLDAIGLVSAQEEISKMKLPIKISLKLARAMRLARGYFEDFEKVRAKIVEDAGIIVGENLTKDQQQHNEKLLPEANKKLAEAATEKITIDFEPIDLGEYSEEEIGKLSDFPVNLLEKTWWLWK